MKTTNTNKVQVDQKHSMQLRPRRFPVAPRPVPASFTSFLKLPIELRFMIWKLARPQRFILATPPNSYVGGWKPMHLSGPTRALNAVCKEAQIENDKGYDRLTVYRRRDFIPRAVVTDAGKLPFNPSLDTLFACKKGSTEHKSYFIDILESRPEGHGIKKLALSDERLLPHCDRHLAAFIKLDELTIIVGRTNLPTRTKVLRPGFELDLEQEIFGGPVWEGRSYNSGWWGRGACVADHTERAYKLLHLISELKAIEEKEEGAKMPTVQIMVMNERECKQKL